jgi:hypothetical protein
MSNDCDVLTSVSVSLMTEILMIWSNQVLNWLTYWVAKKIY